MEGLHGRLATGDPPGGQEHPPRPESPRGDPRPESPSTRQQQQTQQQQQTPPRKPHAAARQTKQSRRTHPQRKRLKHQHQSLESDAMTEGSRTEEEATATTTTTTVTVAEAPATATTAKLAAKVTRVPSSAAGSIPAEQAAAPEGAPKLKRERKPPRPGKYVCSYCGRACAKPSVLQKHIRSHTGERPYPCAPCGFSFKTKSNLYKHRKSHTHRVKAGLAFSEPRSLEEQVTESEDEAKQLPPSASGVELKSSTTPAKTHESDGTKDASGGMDDSYAVKKRLAMRLSRGKRGPLDSSDDRLSSSLLGSRGSTESGYFSRSESTEQTQDSPPNTSAKSYAEIILGKYGRLGHLQRMSRHQNQQLSGEEEKNIPFTVPKKQVIDHITKLITINEAVVDTSKIDSVKPRRFSLSRKTSSESQKSVNIKEPIANNPKSEEPSYKNSGSITMGVPCEKFQHQSLKVDPLAPHTSAGPLLRSQSMPFPTSSLDASSSSPPRFRQSQSFEQRTPSQLQTPRRFGMLRRQPAIEIPLSAELPQEDHCSLHTFHQENLKTTVPDHTPTRPQAYKSQACGAECENWEGFKPHKQSVCSAQNYGNVSVSFANQKDHPQVIIHPVRPGSQQAMRKRRKEDSFESDDPSFPVACSSPSRAFPAPPQCREESVAAREDAGRPKPHTLSVIQHTSSFEKQDASCAESTRKESRNSSPKHQDYPMAHQKPPQQQQQHPTEPTPRPLVRQHSVRVPEILVTEDSNMDTQSSFKAASLSKQPERQEEFQWPQRSPTLARLPIEKLPPKKKRLRLAELAQSSGESSFDSLPRSPSQDSSASYASSRSASFEEPGRVDSDVTSATPLRRSRAPHTLAVPGMHPHREMRRSASEQAPHDPQQGALASENRSKSFDYSCLSPERSAVGWRERRKCLLLKHSVVRDPEEEGEGCEAIAPLARLLSGLVGAGTSSDVNSSAVSDSAASGSAAAVASPLSGDRVSVTPTPSPHRELFSQWKVSQNIQLAGRSDPASVDVQTAGSATEGSGSSVHPLVLPPRCVQQYPGTQGLSGAARAHYLPMSTGLKLEIPTQASSREYSRVQASSLAVPIPSQPSITINPELLRTPPSPAVPVRLQGDTFPVACAIYTVQSQTAASSMSTLQLPVSAALYGASAAPSTHRGRSTTGPETQDLRAEDPLRPWGAGGSKRMLSPSNSIEFSPESQQQQKRVKEEEEAEEERRVKDRALADARGQNKEDHQRRRPGACSPANQAGASCPGLECGTRNSWCYLNYVKPNPFALDERRPSVYSTWSTGSHNPNPPGLSSKTALSLLQCKQSLGPTVYTTSPMGGDSGGGVETLRAADNQRRALTEVSSSLSCDREHASTREEALSAEDRLSNKGDEEGEREQEEEEEEGPNQAAKYRHPSQPWSSDEGSSQQSGLAHARGGHGNPTKHAKVPGKTRYREAPPPHHTDEGVCDGPAVVDPHAQNPEECHAPRPQARGATFDINNNNEGEGDDGGADADVKGSRRGVPSASPTHQSVGGEPAGGAGGPPTRTPSAGSRRALFARRQLPTRTATPPPDPTPLPARARACTRSPPGLRHPQSASPVPAAVSPRTSPGLQIQPSPVGGASPCSGLNYASLAGSSAPPHRPPRGGAAAGARANKQADRTLPCLRPEAVPPPPPPPLPPAPRSSPGVLSHLPLHSQEPAGGGPPGLTIAIGGIHMIQPRRAPPYRPASDPAGGGGGDRRPSLLRADTRLEPDEEEEQEEEQEEQAEQAGPSPSHGDGPRCARGRPRGGKARAACAGAGVQGIKPPRFWREADASTLTQGAPRRGVPRGAKRRGRPETRQEGQRPPAGETRL